MNSIKFDIIIQNENDRNFLLQKQKKYSYGFRLLYSNPDKINNHEFEEFIKNNYKLSGYEYNCLCIDVKGKIDAVTKTKENTEQKIVDLEEDIKTLNKSKVKTKKVIRKIFRLNQKLEYHKSRLCKDITFGTLKTIRRLSFLNNDKDKNLEEIKRVKQEFEDGRILGFNYVGSLNDKNSNRYFEFDFENNKVYYKPYKGRVIEIDFVLTKNKMNDLIKLQEIKDNKFIPITVRLSHDNIVITFDEEKLNGFGFDEKGYKKELQTIDKSNSDAKKNLGIKYKQEQAERKLENKIKTRYCSIDLNPEFIGVSIFDKINDEGELKLIDVFTYDLTDLMAKSNKLSSDKQSKFLTNKRKFEIGNIYKKLFNKVKHYNCAYFVIEDLEFKVDNKDNASKEANRKTKNIWNRNYQYNLITKHCNINGIILIEVNPAYSSFIGNMMYTYFDPSNSAIEIGRRGIVKYIKGNKFYPPLTETIIDTALNRLGLSDVQWLKAITWKGFYDQVKETGVKYRWQLDDVSHRCFSKNTIKTKWKLYSFN